MKLPDIEIKVNPGTNCGSKDLGYFGVVPESLLLDTSLDNDAKMVYAYLWHWRLSGNTIVAFEDIARALNMDLGQVSGGWGSLYVAGYVDDLECPRGTLKWGEVAYELLGGNIRSLEAGRDRSMKRKQKRADEAASMKE